MPGFVLDVATDLCGYNLIASNSISSNYFHKKAGFWVLIDKKTQGLSTKQFIAIMPMSLDILPFSPERLIVRLGYCFWWKSSNKTQNLDLHSHQLLLMVG